MERTMFLTGAASTSELNRNAIIPQTALSS
jgi:isopentenyl diphosphate isomerase/L-lactate dehydrogenase-like FMN-dependent dehydrogenase